MSFYGILSAFHRYGTEAQNGCLLFYEDVCCYMIYIFTVLISVFIPIILKRGLDLILCQNFLRKDVLFVIR